MLNRTNWIILTSIVIACFGREVAFGLGPLAYTATRTNNSVLYLTDSTTGTQTPLGPTGIQRVQDLEYWPTTGDLYGLDWLRSFYKFDTTTGLATLIKSNIIGIEGNSALAFAPNHTLYGISGASLFTINLTSGNLTTVSSLNPFTSTRAFAISQSGAGIAWDEGSNFLYGIDLPSGATHSLGLLNGRFEAFDYGPGGKLFGWDNGLLYEIDVAGLSAQLTDAFAVQGWAFAVVPEPTGFATGTMCALLIAGKRRVRFRGR